MLLQIRSLQLVRCCLGVFLALVICSSEGAYELVWSDEFDNVASNAPNSSNWNYDLGAGGWGNNEIQYYTNSRSNSYVQDGYLYIVARKEKIQNSQYSSARLKSQNLQQFQYGKIEARIRLPLAIGSWPAFWMLGANFQTVGWPGCGEIDILEWVQSMVDSPFAPTNGQVTRASAHGPGYSGANSVHGDTIGSLNADFHVYAVEWTPSELRYYMDGANFFSATPSPWVFDHPFFVILNLALGGWGGAIDPAVTFPINMTVDYVRVYQDPTIATPPTGILLRVSSIRMGVVLSGPTWKALATVTVVDSSSVPVAGVVITGTWSGLINVGVTQVTTNSTGQAELSSGKVKVRGTIKFCVESLTKSGYTYVYPNPPDCNQITY